MLNTYLTHPLTTLLFALTYPLAEALDLSWLSTFGPSGAALLVMYLYLQYNRKRDEDFMKAITNFTVTADGIRKEMSGMVDKFDLTIRDVTGKFDSTVREIQNESRQNVQTLFTLQKETVQTMFQFKEEVRMELRNISIKLPLQDKA